MRSMDSLLDTGLAEATPKRDPLPWIKQKAAEVTKQAEQHDAAHALTPRVRHLIDEAVELEIEQARNAGATGYIAHFLAQATLPHTDPKTNHFKRGTGKLSLSIVANPDYGVPYGGLPRLLLAWMCTEAVRTGSPDLSLGRSQAAFLQSLDLHNDGRYIARVRDQSLRLVHSMITVGGADGDALHVRNILIAEEAFVFWSSRDTVRRGAWESSITLSTDFFKRLISAPVPLKMEALRALIKSPLAMDIYTWLVYRMFTLNVGASKGGKRLVHVPWTGLMMQFGSGYANTPKGLANFKTNFRLRLNEALLFYPEARNHIEETKDCLILTPARLHIAATKRRG
ncbi:replication protein RepA [Pseudomonas aeruginosa]|uniref:replication protein RepA n=1 Tax=Pseudomonas aeruginosa TaxID=287 RepID=UPI000F53B256|nr:replication protein RepA [Pseudomonas aeruginosa]RPW08439.1 RepA [Pseudomonas aeruginosa]WCW07060.1 RepA [Pseudomonas aeruginosa]